MATICVAGLSCRSLASSLHQLGWNVIAYDVFGDRDLRMVAEYRSMEQLQSELRNATIDRERLFMLAGGMENRLEWVDQIHAFHTLIGPSPQQMRELRDIRLLRGHTLRSEVRFPPIIEQANAQPVDSALVGAADRSGSWLVKPYRSGGGLGIQSWSGEQICDGTYLQKRIAGKSISSILLMKADASGCSCHGAPNVVPSGIPLGPSRSDSRTRLLFLSEALTPAEWYAPSEFGYRGSITCPSKTKSHGASRESKIDTEAAASIKEDTIRKMIGFWDRLAEELQLCGLIQADWILDELGQLWLIEVNPRWAASYEVAELSLGINLAEAQLNAFGMLTPKTTPSSTTSRAKIVPFHRELRVGKAIVYATRPCSVSSTQSDAMLERSCSDPSSDGDFPTSSYWFADIPSAGSFIHPDQPIATVLATGDNDFTLKSRLREGKAELHRIINRT